MLHEPAVFDNNLSQLFIFFYFLFFFSSGHCRAVEVEAGIEGITDVAVLSIFITCLCPWHLLNPLKPN